MTKAVLHVIIDPLCGWCYGAAPLLEVAKKELDVSVKLYGGGLLVDEAKRKITPYWADYVKPHDARIAQLTGQLFGDQYYNTLLKDESIILDSVVPIKALMAIKQLKHDDLELLRIMQIAHYQQGQCAADPYVLFSLVEKMGLSKVVFSEAYYAITLDQVHSHIQQARAQLQALGGQGFPTMGLGFQEGRLELLAHEKFYGRESDWVQYLHNKLELVSRAQLSAVD